MSSKINMWDIPWADYPWLNPGLSHAAAAEYKRLFDDNDDFPFKCWLTCTYKASHIKRMNKELEEKHPHLKHQPTKACSRGLKTKANPNGCSLCFEKRVLLDEWREKQAHRFFIKLMRKNKVHALVDFSLSPIFENEHFHAMVQSKEEPIKKSSVAACWEYGREVDFSKYDPLYGLKFFNDEQRTSIRYTFCKHHPVFPAASTKRIYHPHKTACRKGYCPVCKQGKAGINLLLQLENEAQQNRPKNNLHETMKRIWADMKEKNNEN